MTRDEVLLLVLLVAFALLVTVHLTLAMGLAARPRRWRAAVALVVPPLAPYWGFRERMWIRSAVWVASAIAYAASFTLARGR